MKATFNKETEGWCIKIYSDKFDKRSITKMHKLLDNGIEEIKEVKKTVNRLIKDGYIQ